MSGERMTISRALEMALTRNTGPRNEVSLTLDRDGNVSPRVTATHDDLNEAERAALASMERVQEKYPRQANGHAPELSIKLSRNAKGETQIEVSGEGAAVVEEYERLRARYPLSDGTVSHDAPKPAAKK